VKKLNGRSTSRFKLAPLVWEDEGFEAFVTLAPYGARLKEAVPTPFRS